MKYTTLVSILMLVLLAATGLAQTTTLVSSSNALNDADIVSGKNLRIYLLNQDPDPAEPGKYVELRFRFLNGGSEALEDIQATLNVDYPFSFDTPEDATVDLGTLASRQLDEYGALVKWKLRVDKDAIEGDHEVSVNVELTPRYSYVKEDFMVSVRTQDPILSVAKIETTPEKAIAGGETKISITLENQADSYLKDLVVFLDTRASSFAPLGSTTEKTFKTMGAGERKVITYDLAVDADATSKVHEVPLLLTYLDSQGATYTKNLTTGIRVDNPPKYILNLEETQVKRNNEKGKVIVSFSNVGKGDLNFVRVKLLPSDDYELLSAPLSYMGNLESDDFQTSEFTIYTTSEKEAVPLKVEVSFADEYNKEYVMEHSLDIKLYDQTQAVKYGIATQENNSSLFFSFIIGFLALVFWISMLADVYMSSHTKGKKVMWFLVVLVANVIGAVLYYLIGRKKGE